MPDVVVEEGHHRNRFAHVAFADVLVGGDAVDAAGPQHVAARPQQPDRLEQRLRDHRFHGVELQLPGLSAEPDGEVVAAYLVGDLVDHLGNDGVDLGGHDRAARLHRGQVDLVEPGARPGAQQPQVIADLRQLRGQAFAGRVGHHIGAGIRSGLDQVGGGDERASRDLAEVFHRQLPVSGRGVQPGADRRRAQIDLQQQRACVLEVTQLLLQVHREGCELLPQCHRYRILQLGASKLEDVLELLALVIEGVGELLDRMRQLPKHVVEGHPEARWEGVVGGLAVVDVVVGVDDVVASLREPEVLQSKVREYLVGVHIHRRPRATLEDIDRELVHAAFSHQHLVTGLEDRPRHPAGEDTEFAIRQRRRFLHLDHSANQLGNRVHGDTRDGEVLDGSQRVNSVPGVIRDLTIAE